MWWVGVFDLYECTDVVNYNTDVEQYRNSEKMCIKIIERKKRSQKQIWKSKCHAKCHAESHDVILQSDWLLLLHHDESYSMQNTETQVTTTNLK